MLGLVEAKVLVNYMLNLTVSEEEDTRAKNQHDAFGPDSKWNKTNGPDVIGISTAAAATAAEFTCVQEGTSG